MNTKTKNPPLAIRRGNITQPQKAVVYGPEGVGKSTLADRFPEPVFLDTDRGTYHPDVARCDSAAECAAADLFRDFAPIP
jgi:hypothetical protein